MKSIKISALCTLFVASSTLAASNNTINFQGEVTSQTCSATVNGQSASPVILLPTVAASQLATSGATAGATTFTMGVNCTTAVATSTKISTVFVGNNVATDGNLTNTGTAGKVEIQILDSAGTAIPSLANYKASGDLTLAAAATTKSATYTAQYYATGQATAGTVLASMQYSISYQ